METKNTNFSWVNNEIISDPELAGMEKATYLVLCMFANSKTNKCYPKILTIAEKLGCSDNSVAKYLERLEELGYIEITKRKGTSNSYTILKREQYMQRRQNYAKSTETISEVATGGSETISEGVPKPFRNSAETISDKQEEINKSNNNKKKEEKSGILGLGKSAKKETKVEKALRRVKEEKWTEMTPTDWTVYYVHQHEEIMGNKTDFNPNSNFQVKWFREGFLEKYNIPPERLKEYIDTLFTLYRDDPNVKPEYQCKLPLSIFKNNPWTVEECVNDVYRKLGRPDVGTKYSQPPEPVQQEPEQEENQDNEDWRNMVF